MPRKGTRHLSIGDQKYRWRAWYGQAWKDGYCIPLRLIVELGSAQPGQRLRAMFRNGRNEIWYLEDQAVTPRVVRRIIDAALERGWRPGESGLPLFDMDGQPFLDAELFLNRTARELRGIGWVKIVGRLERDYGVDLRRLDFDRKVVQPGRDLSVSDLWDRVSKWFRRVWEAYQPQGFSVPQVDWESFTVILAEELSIPHERVRLESRLAADLGMGADVAEPAEPPRE